MAQLPPDLRELAGRSDGARESVIVTRRLGKAGRNRCYVNDSSVTLTAMAGVAGGLLSFAGQHEYRRLLDPGVPAGGARPVGGARDARRWLPAYRAAFERARESSRRLEESLRARSERLREIELLRFQIAELSGRRAVPGGRSGTAGRAARPRPGRGPAAQPGPGRGAAQRATDRAPTPPI